MSEKFKRFMSETKEVDRWFVLKVGIGGAFCGSLLTLAVNMVGLL